MNFFVYKSIDLACASMSHTYIIHINDNRFIWCTTSEQDMCTYKYKLNKLFLICI